MATDKQIHRANMKSTLLRLIAEWEEAKEVGTGLDDFGEFPRTELRRKINDLLRENLYLVPLAQKNDFTPGDRVLGMWADRQNDERGRGTGEATPHGPPSPGQDKPWDDSNDGAQQGRGGTGQGADAGTGAGASGKGGQGDGSGQSPNLREMARDGRLLGDFGKDFNLVRGPKGTFAAVYKYKLGGEVIKVAINLGKDPGKLAKYGLKASDAKSLNKQQMKQIQSIGYADELAPHIRKGDKHVMKSLVRHLRNQYGGQAILENDEVMSVVIANSMFGWSAGEFENKLRQTKWYQNTNDYQLNWVTVTSPKQKADTIKQITESVIDVLEDQYGFDWAKYVDVKKVKSWAEKIASGKWGDPGAGLAFWSERQEDKAAAIVGTPAYVRQQTEAENVRGYMNRPEDKKEALMSQARAYLGPHYVPDDATLLGWATDIVTEKKTDADWMEYLRKQSKALHPYKDEYTPWQDFASPYRAAAERVFGTTIEWDDAALSNLQGTKDDGSPLGTPMAAYDFEQYLRDNDPRFWANPETEERGRAFGQELLSMMGVA